METKIQITKLNNKNYHNWKFKMELLLIKEKVWNTISEAAPTTLTTDWIDKNNTARVLIGLNVEDTQLSYVRNQTSAKGAWDALKNIYENDSVVNLVTLIREMYATKMDEGDDLQIHLDKVTNLFEKINDLGEKLSDMMKIGIILSSLPISWSTLVTALEVRKKEELTMPLVLSKLSDEEIRRKIHPGQKEEKILKIGEKQQYKPYNQRQNSFSSGERNEPNIFCYFCKKRNHIMRDCRKFKEYSEKNKANLLTENDEDDDYLLNLTSTEDETNQENHFSIQSNGEEWTLDSGATSQMTSSKEEKVKVANGIKVNAMGRGNCKVQFNNGEGKRSNGTLTEVLYVPDIKGNFISIQKLTQKGFEVKFYNEKADISFKGKVIATAKIKNELYKLSDEVNAVNEIKNKKQCIHYYHRVFGHRNFESLKKMFNEKMVTGIELKRCNNCQLECEVCLQSKMSRKTFKKVKATTTKKCFDLIHTDLCGPMRTMTHTNRKYILTFIDDYSRYTTIFLLREKSEVNDKLIQYVTLLKNQFNAKPKRFNSNRGGEYFNRSMEEYMNSEGIEFQHTAPYTPQLNG